jgi:hypothetical protein
VLDGQAVLIVCHGETSAALPPPESYAEGVPARMRGQVIVLIHQHFDALALLFTRETKRVARVPL